MISKQLSSDDVLKTLAQNFQAIQKFGVLSLALFGSVASDRAYFSVCFLETPQKLLA
ncbi:MAG: hypothetical protein WBM86_09525 [Waterburya sp.]